MLKQEEPITTVTIDYSYLGIKCTAVSFTSTGS
ncbi:hypothetical protein BRLA_c037360 [Brevibacillus laterosporus LMG 15441]|uniref:Uncharacterized protein n=1 Tax=Brevibacillus laterosporus LMG 15441 TaxID=1042163 RepID=A0A075R9U8_BRELA|nr:hypothetical protein BRLA_c037360 [Brevibacillus laterosporus LMG 15441]